MLNEQDRSALLFATVVKREAGALSTLLTNIILIGNIAKKNFTHFITERKPINDLLVGDE